MKKTDGFLKNKQLRIILFVVIAAIAVTGGLTVRAVINSMKEFDGDGYILVPSKKGGCNNGCERTGLFFRWNELPGKIRDNSSFS